MQASKAADSHFDKHFVFSDEPHARKTSNAKNFKKWTPQEQEVVRKLLEHAETLCPQFIERACAIKPLKLVRCERYYHQRDRAWLNMPRSAFAVAETDAVIICDGCFEDPDESKVFEILLHELTHEADLMRRVSFTPEWQKYFESYFRVDYRNYDVREDDPKYKPYASNLCEGLADTYPKYLLGKSIPDKRYFEETIVPLLLQKSSTEELSALKNFFDGEVAYKSEAYGNARIFFEKTIEASPNSIEANNMYVYTLSKQGAYADALAWSKKCIQIMDAAKLPENEPERISMYGMRAWLLVKRTYNYLEAKRLIEHCLDVRPSDEYLIKLLQFCNTELKKQERQALRNVS